MAVSIPIRAVQDARQADSELWRILLAIAGPESGWRSQAKGDCKLNWGGAIIPCAVEGSFPTSFGYTQLHIDGGLGAGYAPEVLLDGVTNFRLAARHIRGELSAGKSLYDALWPWSARPEIWALYQRIQSEEIVEALNGNGNGRVINGKVLPRNDLIVPVIAILLLLVVIS